MTAKDAQDHMEDLKGQLSLELFNQETLKREIALLEPKFLSKIAIPKRTINIRNLKQDDLDIDVVPANLADMENIQARKAYYYAKKEEANTIAAIETIKEMYHSYKAHVAQELNNQSKPLSDESIFDAYRAALALKDLSEQDKEALKAIGNNLLPTINGPKDKKIEVLEILQNLIKQYG